MKSISKYFPLIVAVAMLINTPFTFASSPGAISGGSKKHDINEDDEQVDTLRLGKFVSFDETEDGAEYKIIGAEVTTIASTSGTRSEYSRGCYKTRTETGKEYPYEYTYTHYHAVKVLDSNIEDTTSISFRALEKSKSEVREEVRSLIENRWARVFCLLSGTTAILLQVELIESKKTIRVQLILNQDSNGYYIEKSYGKVYIADHKVDFIAGYFPRTSDH